MVEQYQTKKRAPDRVKKTLSDIPPYTVFFFTLFLLNTIIPLFDLPVIGLSLTAPLMLIVGIQVMLKPSAPWIKEYQLWWFLAAAIWLMWFTSAVINSFIGNLEPASSSQLTYFARTFYWLFVMVITIYVVSRKVNGNFLMKILNIGIFILGAMRLFEAFFYGRIGAGTSRILSQNNYGILFSSFAIYPIILLFEQKGPKKLLQFVIVGVVYASIIINSSRSSWVALLIGVVVLLFFLWQARKIRFSTIMVICFFILLIYLISSILIPDLSSVINPDAAIIKRLETFSNLEADQSYGIRQFLIRKAIAQFKSSPIIGIGVERGRFVQMQVELPESIKNYSEILTKPMNEHNSYIQILAETGLLGVIPYSILLLTLLLKGFRSALNMSRQGLIWAAAIFASFVAMSFHLWTITALRTTSSWVVYGLLGGMIMFFKKAHGDTLKIGNEN